MSQVKSAFFIVLVLAFAGCNAIPSLENLSDTVSNLPDVGETGGESIFSDVGVPRDLSVRDPDEGDSALERIDAEIIADEDVSVDASVGMDADDFGSGGDSDQHLQDADSAQPECGNGVVETGESCDDGNTISETCDYGEAGCTICASDCTEQTGTLRFCGDGETDAEEGCDDGNTVTEVCGYGEVACTVCAADCTEQAGAVRFCGDGVQDEEEFCDDGNTVTESCDYGRAGCTVCAADCTLQGGTIRVCGDGVLDEEEFATMATLRQKTARTGCPSALSVPPIAPSRRAMCAFAEMV